MSRTLHPLASLRTSMLFVILTVLTAVFSVIGLEFSYGAEFMLCGATLLIMLVLYGSHWAAIMALIVGLGFYFSGNGSFILLLIGLEMILVGYMYERKRGLLLLWDSLFWFGIGAPLAVMLFYLQTNEFNAEALLQYFMFAMSGLLNALIADVVVTYMPWKRLMPDLRTKSVYLNQLLMHLSVAIVFIPFLLNMLIDSRDMQRDIERDSITRIELQTAQITDTLLGMGKKERQGINLGSIMETGKLRDNLKLHSQNGLLKLAAYNKRGQLVASSDEVWFERNGGYVGENVPNKSPVRVPANHSQMRTDAYGVRSSFSRILPPDRNYDYGTRRWNDGYYVLEDRLTDHPIAKVVGFIPISYFLQTTIDVYLRKFLMLFMVCLLATGVSLAVSRFIVRSLGDLEKATAGMHHRLLKDISVKWPCIRIGEIRSLALNFRAMGDRLTEVFKELLRMNEKLLDQTKMLELSEERLQHIAYYDTLTQLPNRHFFTMNVERALDAAENKASSLALMFIDIDRFKHINDSLGHNVGDMLLVQVAQRLSDCLSKLSGRHLSSRYGGDEFIIMLEDSSREEISAVANRILHRLRESFHVQSHELFVSASIGVSLYPDNGHAYTDLLKQADTAMYAAKDGGGHSVVFYDELQPQLHPERMFMETRLYKALQRREMLLHYQPIVDVSGEVTGAEVLLRWLPEEGGFISPAQFIPVAEETGLIVPIGEWVLRTACMQYRMWMDAGMPSFQLSINVSLRQLLAQDFVSTIDRIIRDYELYPSDLILEITEGYMSKSIEQVNEVLSNLKRRGVQIGIDDFGTGYSSLHRLRTLPVHVLKIDRSFVRHLFADKVNASIVQAIIQMGDSMNLKVTAEGIETSQELDQLIALGCKQFQGYYISPPLAADEFAARFPDFSSQLRSRPDSIAAYGG
ncbi:EAL domain-containing protein [Paenibacillus alvei]|uniref:EAL domain-containing protein n=1 Tax=Paenibacillus alvei TaxID=44250 RepID=UPI0002889775|nr:EAL domain-containing protein [Paenibacillus alvei]EJW19620.1 diguanylate cyclase (GGDEF) domain protein [Paenibacillus alvei DSM 29]MCY9541438.1 EAL domain-containing protein [Paenibacillus alvei]MCY9702655.1 EAL domain-containing protein [Paenibacillus alvei]MCY9733038.1 EAL domain-containing protein [Paenibacillus alvei]MCY9756473.1 EAL domain-containing protein [Paenibacillus alvei]